MNTFKAISVVNFRNYVGGYITLEDMKYYIFDAVVIPDEVEEGFGPLTEKGELSPSAIIHPRAGKRVLRAWWKRTPFGIGILLSRYNIKFYLTFWLVGVGFIPEEVIWERQEMKSSQGLSSDAVQSAIT